MGDKINVGKKYNDAYETSDSEDEYSEEEKELLKEVRKGRQREDDGRKELMAFADSDDEEEDDGGDGGDSGGDDKDDDDLDDLMHDSDIEGAGDDDDDDVADTMDWGKNTKNYYNTDFVDPDFSSYTAEQEELAKLEEEEAKAIQLRLAKQMKESDFELNDFFSPSKSEIDKEKSSADQKDKEDTTSSTTKLKADFSGLSKREKQQLFQKDSPEFAPLVQEFEELMKEVENLHNPVLNYVKENDLPMIPAFEFAKVHRNLALTYCSNISFYLLLKTKRIPIRKHPVIKRLSQFKNLLVQLQDKYDNIIKPQLEALLERIRDNDKFEVLPIKSALTPAVALTTKKKAATKLSILNKYDKPTAPSIIDDNEDTDMVDDNRIGGVVDSTDEEEDEPEEGDDNEEEYDLDENARRGITYEIAKNKGLTPHRKKESRNPRVKHRNRFRKAIIRRKGAVRTVRKESKRYGGEISGIKATVSKSIKFKS